MKAHTRRIAAGTVEASDKPELDRVGGRREDNWNGRCYLFCRHRQKCIADEHDHGTVHEFSQQSRQRSILAAGVTVFDRHVLPVDKTTFPEALTERLTLHGNAVLRIRMLVFEMGHSRRFDARPVTSGPPLTADLARPAR
jgi:hypothetical protein